MTLKTRRILFYSLAVLFISAGTAAIFYSNGWRFDVETFEINKLGAMYFESIPRDAAIAIDKNSFIFRPGILKSGTLVANLFPKTYAVKITKEGYQSWIKEIEVLPSLVTEIPPVILLPENQELGKPFAENIEDFWIGPKHLILYRNGQLEFNGQRILGKSVIRWSKSGDLVITKSDNSYFLTDLLKPSGALNISLVFSNLAGKHGIKANSVSDIFFDTTDDKKLIINSKNGLYLVDTAKLNIEMIFEGSASIAVEKNELIFSDGENLFAHNLTLGTAESLIGKKFQKVSDIQLSPSGFFVGILEQGGAAYLFDRRSLTLEKITDNAIRQLFSPDDEKLVLVGTKELTIHPLRKSSAATALKPKQPATLNIGMIDGQALAWHKNSAYLFVKYPSSLYLLEANDLPPINFQVVDLANRKYAYSQTENSIYLFKGNNLYKLFLE